MSFDEMPQTAFLADYMKKLNSNIQNPGTEIARHGQALEDGINNQIALLKQQFDEEKAQNEKLSSLLKVKEAEAASKKSNSKMKKITIAAGIAAIGSFIANIIMTCLMV